MKRILAAMLLFVSSLFAPGCATTGDPAVDAEITRANLELALYAAREFLEIYKTLQEDNEERDEEEYQRELQRRQELIDSAQRALDRFLAATNKD